MSNLIFLASVKAVMSGVTCSSSIFVMFLKHTPFSRAWGLVIVLNLHHIGVSSHLTYSDNFAGRLKHFLGP